MISDENTKDEKQFAPGMRVIIRDEEWLVVKATTNDLGNATLECVGASPLVKDRRAIFLSDLDDPEVARPEDVVFEPDASPKFARSRLFIESLWRARTPTDPALRLARRAAMDVLDYQLEPAWKALNSLRPRILIADAVGLGKTLEAGVLLSELIARGKGRRILVATTKNMTAQFQKEMWRRFAIPLVRLDSKRIRDVRKKLPANYNPFEYYDKTIISIDTLKRDVEYRAHLEKARWDVIVIDEAQNVAERGAGNAQRARLARDVLANRSDAMIMLSATPHDGRAQSFASLMNILDPTAIPDPQHYGREEVGGLFVRRFKKDVANQTRGAFRERRSEIVRAVATPEEDAAFDALDALELRADAGRRSSVANGMLFKTTLVKALFSSPIACQKTLETRLRNLAGKKTENARADSDALRRFLAVLEKIGTASTARFSRYRRLVELLRSAEYAWRGAANDRLVIFTERVDTMNLLRDNLRRDLADLFPDPQKAIVSMHGGLSDVEQMQIVEDFGRGDAPTRVLVATDVASEGLNLHFLCHRVIHFDAPWSLMVYQQRNGRVDRYGQEQQPDIRYLFIESKNERVRGDSRIFEVLIEKEKQASENIGDVAQLMNLYSQEGEEAYVAEAIESGKSAEEIEKTLDLAATDDPLAALLGLDQPSDSADPIGDLFAAANAKPQSAELKTLFSDREYLKFALDYLAANAPEDDRPPARTPAVRELPGFGLEVGLVPSMLKRLRAQLPDEVPLGGATFKLTDQPKEMMAAMRQSRANAKDVNARFDVHYLWPLHPIFEYVNEKCALLFGRGKAPLLTLDSLARDETIFLVSGVISNRQSTPVVDEFFALAYKSGEFRAALDLEDFVAETKIDRPSANRCADPSAPDVVAATQAARALAPDVVRRAEERLERLRAEYQARVNPRLEKERAKLKDLFNKRDTRQRQLFEKERWGQEARNAERRKTEKIFNDFETWVADSMTIEGAPYLRIVAVVCGSK